MLSLHHTPNHANATWQAPGESAIEGGRRTLLRSRRDFERKQLSNAGADVFFFTPLPESTTTNGAAAGRLPARRGGGGGARRRAARPAAVLKAMRVDGNGLKARWGAEEGARQGAFAARPREATPKQPSGGGGTNPEGQAPRAHERRPSGISHPPSRPLSPPSYLARRVVDRAQTRSI